MIKEPPGVHLLYDVIRYEDWNVDDGNMEKAILHVTKNALVCETADDAKFVAYSLRRGQRFNAVSLDGRYFQMDGVISGCSLYVS